MHLQNAVITVLIGIWKYKVGCGKGEHGEMNMYEDTR